MSSFDNMRFLSRLRSTGAIPQLKFSFTYQLGNFREMRAFVDFCERMNADFAIFERLQNIAFTHEEYRRKAVHYPDHPLYVEFIEVIKDPIFRAKRVWHDFDYPDVDKMSSEEVRERLYLERARIESMSLGVERRWPSSARTCKAHSAGKLTSEDLLVDGIRLSRSAGRVYEHSDHYDIDRFWP